MTPCESVVKKIMGEPYAGNPQVRFEEEGGNPTFTLRFVDGMSLYRGYFAVNSLDWLGLAIKECCSKSGVITHYDDTTQCCKNGEIYWIKEVAIKIQSELVFSEATKGEFNRILNECMSKCKCIKVYAMWSTYSSDQKREPPGLYGGVGKERVAPDGVVINVDPWYNDSHPGVGQTHPSGDVSLLMNQISAHAPIVGITIDEYLGLTMAHEVLHHSISGNVHSIWDYFFPTNGFVDSRRAKIGGVLSPNACKGLCDKLGGTPI